MIRNSRRPPRSGRGEEAGAAGSAMPKAREHHLPSTIATRIAPASAARGRHTRRARAHLAQPQGRPGEADGQRRPTIARPPAARTAESRGSENAAGPGRVGGLAVVRSSSWTGPRRRRAAGPPPGGTDSSTSVRLGCGRASGPAGRRLGRVRTAGSGAARAGTARARRWSSRPPACACARSPGRASPARDGRPVLAVVRHVGEFRTERRPARRERPKRSGPRFDPRRWVGLTGFEPAASSSRTRRATKLRHSPIASRDHRASAASLPERRRRYNRARVTRDRRRDIRASRAGGSAGWPRGGRQAGSGRTARCRDRPRRAASTSPDRPVASRPGGGGDPGRGRARGRSW